MTQSSAPPLVRGALSTHIYFLVMMSCSALTLLRGFAVAAIVDTEAFGTYAMAIGVGAFLGLFVSLGTVEATWKKFPTLWANGLGQKTIVSSRKLDRTLLYRVLGAMGVVVLPAAFLGAWEWVIFAIAVGGYTFSIAVTSSGGSFLRASGDLSSLGKATALRTSVALVSSLIGAWVLSWPGAVLGEVLAALFYMGYVEVVRRRHENIPTGTSSPLPDTDAKAEASETRGGQVLFLAGIAAAAPIYLDRLYVSSLIEPELLGTYGFVMMFNVGALTLAGITVQKVGPQIVRMIAQGAELQTILICVVRWIGLLAGVLIVGLSIAGVLLLVGPLDNLGSKYGVTMPMMVAVTLLCVGQAFIQFDWVLLGLGEERMVLAASLVLFAATAIGFWLIATAEATIVSVILILAGAKALQLVVQLIAILRLLSLRAAGR